MTEPTTQALIELADKYAFFMPGSAEGAKVRQQLLDALEAQASEIERLQVEAEQLRKGHFDASETASVLRAELASIRAQGAVAIPADVREAAKNMQKNEYRGPLAWAVKVIDFVADYAAPVVDVNAGLVEATSPDWLMHHMEIDRREPRYDRPEEVVIRLVLRPIGSANFKDMDGDLQTGCRRLT